MDIYFKLSRTVTTSECPWLQADIPAGTKVTRYTGYTYGVVSPEGTAVDVEGIEGFVEIPTNALEPAI